MSKRWRLPGTLILAAALAWRVPFAEVAAALGRLDGRWWLLALGLYCTAQAVSAWRWRLFARAARLGGSWTSYVAYYFVGGFFNLVLPTSVGGDVVRAWYLARRDDGEVATTGRGWAAFLSVFADRVSGVVVLALLAGTAALGSPAGLPRWVTLTAVAAATAALVGPMAAPLVARALRMRLFGGGRFDGVRRLANGGVALLADGPLMIGTAGLSVVVQLLNVALVFVLGQALGLAIAPVYYGVFVPLVTLLTLAPISLNGMGLREAGTVLLLAPVGVGAADALTLALLQFSVFTAVGLLGGVVYLYGGLPRFGATGEAATVGRQAA